MSIALIAVVLALLAGHFLPALSQLRRPDRLLAVLDAQAARLGLPRRDSLPSVALRLLLPVALLAWLQYLLGGMAYGLPSLALGLLVLFLCWGPRDLDRDIAALQQAGDRESRGRALQQLGLDAGRNDSAAAVVGLFRTALDRWFGVLLWFVLLGPAGALLFRLVRLATREPAPAGSALATLRAIVDWPVAQLLVLALALGGNFDAVLEAWREWHRRGRSAATDIGFLDAAALASVVCEQREEAEELAEVAEELAEQGAPPLPDGVPADPLVAAISDAMSLIWRSLVLWLAALAVAVIGGWAG